MRIAIVDDEPLARARLRGLLQALGRDEIVGEAASGLEALALVSSTDPDVVLLDIRLPGMDGLEVARRGGHRKREDLLPAGPSGHGVHGGHRPRRLDRRVRRHA